MAAIEKADPFVSVRVPAYNHEKYIIQCLDSVLSDSYTNKELIIINDGSTDNTGSLIQDWVNKHKDEIAVNYVSRKNKGLTKTLNELIRLCNGDYLVSLASDDCLLDGGIKKRVDYLIEHPNKRAVIGDCLVINSSDKRIFDSGLNGYYKAKLERYYNDESLAREIISNWSVPGTLLMVNKNIYEQIGGYSEDLEIEDWDFYLRMVSENMLGFIDFKVSKYRVHGDNASKIQTNYLKNHGQLIKTAVRNVKYFNGVKKYLLIKQLSIYAVIYFLIYFKLK